MRTSRHVTRALAAAGLCLFLAGCATTSAQPAGPDAAAPTSAPDASLPGATDQSDPVSADADPQATGAVRLVLNQGANQASYHATEQLAGNSLPTPAVGTTSAVSGTLVLNPDGTLDPAQSQVSVDLASLQSDQSRRDNFIKGNTLQTSQYPTATFVPTRVVGLDSPLPTSGQSTFQLQGDLTVHGVTQPVTWQVTAQFDGADVTGNATTTVHITDFGMAPPKAGPVLSIEDAIDLELAFSATRQA
jgi:polyisoprenoid-binding protein YceI